MPKKFLEIAYNALVEARHAVYKECGLSDAKDVEKLPGEIAKHTLLYLVEYFEASELKKNAGETELLGRLRSVLEDKAESIVNILELLCSNVEKLPISFFSRDRGLIYQTFKSVTCWPKFQPYILNQYIHRDRLRLREENKNLSERLLVPLEAQLQEANESSGDRMRVDAENRFRLLPQPVPQRQPQEEGVGVGAQVIVVAVTPAGGTS